jgi:hypothetical protein
LGLLNDVHGYARGAELSLALARALTAIDEFPDPILSVFGDCSEAKLKEVAVHLGNDLADVEIAVAPVAVVLREHPLIGLGTGSMDDQEALQHLRECVDRLYDRDGIPACAAMANLYYARACCGKLFIAEGLRVPNLEAIISDPQSDDAQHARSAVRMHSQMLVGHRRGEKPAKWPSLFWHHCYLSSDCDPEL